MISYIHSTAKHRRSGTTLQKHKWRGSLSREERTREVLPGFPWEGTFETRLQVEEYLSEDEVVCLMCGKLYKNLGIHTKRIHNLDAHDYRIRYNIPQRYALQGKATNALVRDRVSQPHRIAHFLKVSVNGGPGAKPNPIRSLLK